MECCLFLNPSISFLEKSWFNKNVEIVFLSLFLLNLSKMIEVFICNNFLCLSCASLHLDEFVVHYVNTGI